MRKNNLSPITLNTLICGVLLGGMYLFQFYFPVGYSYFIREDSWVEYSTFACYFTAGSLVLWTIARNSSARRPGYILLCLGLFLVAMEEISWGQRLFGIRTPYMLAQYNAQSELSLHNAFFIPAEHLFFYAILIWAVILPEISHRFKRLNVFFKIAGIPLVPREIYPYFISSVFLKNFNVAIEHDEIGEIISGLAFVLFSVEAFCGIYKSTEEANLAKKRLIGWAVTIVLTVPTLLVLARPRDIPTLKRQLYESTTTQYPRYGMNAQTKKIFEHLVRHEELRNDDTLFRYGLFLQKMNSREAEIVLGEALQEAKERILENPDKPAPNILAGKILKELNQPELAQKEFAEALRKDQIRLAGAKLDWQRMDALKSMGETYIEMGKHGLAREHLQKALEYAEDGWTKASIKNLLKIITIQ